MIDLDQANIPVSEAAEIAQLGHRNARHWVTQGFIGSKKKGDNLAGVIGATTYLTGRSVLQMAIAARLVDMGMSPSQACHAAADFTHISDPLDSPGHSRDPGELYEGSRTWLVAYQDGHTRIVRTKSQKLDDLIVSQDTRRGFWVLPLDFIVKAVVIALGKVAA